MFILVAVSCCLWMIHRGVQQHTHVNHTKIQLMFLAAAASEYYDQNRAWPNSLQELMARPASGGNLAIFLTYGTNDFWGSPIVFEPFDLAHGYGRILSLGPDRKPGGMFQGRDIIVHYGTNQQMSFLRKEKLTR